MGCWPKELGKTKKPQGKKILPAAFSNLLLTFMSTTHCSKIIYRNQNQRTNLTLPWSSFQQKLGLLNTKQDPQKWTRSIPKLHAACWSTPGCARSKDGCEKRRLQTCQAPSSFPPPDVKHALTAQPADATTPTAEERTGMYNHNFLQPDSHDCTLARLTGHHHRSYHFNVCLSSQLFLLRKMFHNIVETHLIKTLQTAFMHLLFFSNFRFVCSFHFDSAILDLQLLHTGPRQSHPLQGCHLC